MRELPKTPEECRQLAEFVTKDLQPLVVYDMLLIGPGEWQRRKLHADTLGGLPAKLQNVFEVALASDLARMFTQWREWRVWELRKRRDEALQALYEEERAEREATRKANLPIPPPPGTARPTSKMMREPDDPHFGKPWYVPPGRT
jgi:hypothetical protein